MQLSGVLKMTLATVSCPLKSMGIFSTVKKVNLKRGAACLLSQVTNLKTFKKCLTSLVFNTCSFKKIKSDLTLAQSCRNSQPLALEAGGGDGGGGQEKVSPLYIKTNKQQKKNKPQVEGWRPGVFRSGNLATCFTTIWYCFPTALILF